MLVLNKIPAEKFRGKVSFVCDLCSNGSGKNIERVTVTKKEGVQMKGMEQMWEMPTNGQAECKGYRLSFFHFYFVVLSLSCLNTKSFNL